MLIRSSTALRSNYNEISELAHTSDEPIYITKNGERDLVVMSVDAFEEMHRALDLRAQVLEAEAGRLSGEPSYSVDDVREMLREKYSRVQS